MILTTTAIIRTLATAAALSTLAIALPASGAELRPLVTVEGPLVTLGDLLEGAGDKADIAVFRAPDPGMSGTVRADRVAEAAAGHGIADIDAAGIAAVSVSRAARAIPAEEIAFGIAERLAEGGLVDSPDNAMVEFAGLDGPLHVEASAVAPVEIGAFEHDPRTGRFSALVTVADSAALREGLRVSGRAVRVVEVPVLARVIGRGETIAASDVVLERVARTALRGDHIAYPEDLIGFQARRTLRPGEPLSPGSVTAPVLVERNAVVTVVYRVPGLTLTARGRAIGSGSEGDMVSVVNTQSSRTFQAEVVGHNQVAVTAARPALLRTALR